MKHIPTFESFLNEAIKSAEPKWYPQQFSVLKDLYMDKNNAYTSNGPNMSDWIIKKGQTAKLSQDGTSRPNVDATYDVVVEYLPTDTEKGSTDKEFMYFSLKEIAELLKQGAIEILDKEMFGHNFTLRKMTGIKFPGT